MFRTAIIFITLGIISCLLPRSVFAVDTNPTLGNRIWVTQNGESSEKLDILFIPMRVGNLSTLPTFIDSITNNLSTDQQHRGLFGHPPFDNLKNRFNISYVNQNIDENTYGCYVEQPDPNGPPKWNLDFSCDNARIKRDYAFFSPDYIVVLVDLPLEYHAWGGEVMYLNKNLDNNGFTFTHEFGHQLGLADEYGQGSGQVGYWCGTASSNQISACYTNYLTQIQSVPNLDQVGCPKWCESYDLSLLTNSTDAKQCALITNQADCLSDAVHCNWFDAPHPFLNVQCVPSYSIENIGINCHENTQCLYGAHYGQLAFVPGISIMSGGEEFNQPSKDYFEQIFQCCFPYTDSTSCSQFRSQLSSVNPNTDYYMKIAYNKIGSCASDALTPTPHISTSPNPSGLPKPGDANRDTFINGADYMIWVKDYHQTTSVGFLASDFDYNSSVDGGDYMIWVRYYGT